MMKKFVYYDLLNNAIRNFRRISWLCDQFYNTEVVFVVTKNIFEVVRRFKPNNFTYTYNGKDMSICYRFCGCDLFVTDTKLNGSILFEPAIHGHKGFYISESSLRKGDMLVCGDKLFRFGETEFIDTGLTVEQYIYTHSDGTPYTTANAKYITLSDIATTTTVCCGTDVTSSIYSKQSQKPKEVDFSTGDTKLLDEFLESFSRKDGSMQMGG